MGVTDLVAAVAEAHEHGRDDVVGADAGARLLLELRELEERVLVALDAALQDAQQDVQRVVAHGGLHHVQQRLVLDQPLLKKIRDVGSITTKEGGFQTSHIVGLLLIRTHSYVV